jgi:hypothetical protein
MYSRTYIIGQHEATECPWCALPLYDGEHAIEIVSEHPDKDCIKEGFCGHYCASQWLDDIKEKLIKVVDGWLEGERPIINFLSPDAKAVMDDAVRH